MVITINGTMKTLMVMAQTETIVAATPEMTLFVTHLQELIAHHVMETHINLETRIRTATKIYNFFV